LREQQQPWRFDRVPGDANGAGLLPLLLAIFVEVDDAGDFPARIMLDLGGVRLRTNL
jgi:hypothetical protein